MSSLEAEKVEAIFFRNTTQQEMEQMLQQVCDSIQRFLQDENSGYIPYQMNAPNCGASLALRYKHSMYNSSGNNQQQVTAIKNGGTR